MKHEFLVCPPTLNQAFESASSSGGAWRNGITRRTFLKRTGGATVASLVAWNLSIERAKADVTVASVSYFLKCTGDPHSDPLPSPVTLLFPDGNLVVKLSATKVGPNKGDEEDSFIFRGTNIKAEITCAVGTLQPGGVVSDTWNSGTHKMWLDSSAVTQHTTATPTAHHVLCGTYDMPLGGILAVSWTVSTEVRQDLLYIKTEALVARYDNSATPLVMIQADLKSISDNGWISNPTAHFIVTPIDPLPTIRSKWRTGRMRR